MEILVLGINNRESLKTRLGQQFLHRKLSALQSVYNNHHKNITSFLVIIKTRLRETPRIVLRVSWTLLGFPCDADVGVLSYRYDEEITRLAMNAEFYSDKVDEAKSKLECLRNQQKLLDDQLKETIDLVNRNFLQLNRERKRTAGAVDLKEDFDRHLQQQITTKTKFVQDYAQILGKLEGLVDDSSLQWLQRETMISTESEALERLHESVEKEHNNLQSELHKYESLYVAQAAQNTKLGQVQYKFSRKL